MLRLSGFALALIVAASAAHAANPSQSKSVSYKWVDSKGVVHYGDHVPPEYAKQKRSVLNNQGVEVTTLAAQKTPEQIAAEAEAQRLDMKRREHDTFLLTTYTSTQDIEQLRDVRLAQIAGQRLAAEAYIETLQTRLVSLQTRAQGYRPYATNAGARRMPDDLANDIIRTLNETRTQRLALNGKRAEEESVRTAFQADIDRYRELKRIQATR